MSLVTLFATIFEAAEQALYYIRRNAQINGAPYQVQT